MAQQITSFLADDGKIFDNEAAADAHSAAVLHLLSVEQYIAGAGLLKSQAGLMRKHLPAYSAFLASGVLPVFQEKEVKPKKGKAVLSTVADAQSFENV